MPAQILAAIRTRLLVEAQEASASRTTQGDASAGGMLPGFDMGNMQDRMNNMMADAMNCMQKQTEVSCKDAELRKNVDVPLWYLLPCCNRRKRCRPYATL